MRCLLSSKTGDVLPRSHKGRAAWSCIPLCKQCHTGDGMSIHAMGERKFALMYSLSYCAIIATNLVRFITREEGV